MFWEGTNVRNDDWGGISIDERTKFSTEIVKRSRLEVGNDFPIIFRFSQWKQQDFSHKMAKTPDELGKFLMKSHLLIIKQFYCLVNFQKLMYIKKIWQYIICS